MSPPKISVVMPVLAPTPFLQAMTKFAIKALREHADNPFELIVVEACHNFFDPEYRDLVDAALYADKYLNFTPPVGGVKEVNAGVRAASGDYIVFTGNDVIVPPHWDTELLLPFNRYKDCGISCLAAKEPGAFIGSHVPIDCIVEGMYSPFTMFKKGWEYDESYLRVYQDSDLVMRLYQAGLRAYRNNRTAVHHFGSVTNNAVGHSMDHHRQLCQDEELFYTRWGKSPLMIFAMIRIGQLIYGREHESLLNPIHRHTMPKDTK